MKARTSGVISPLILKLGTGFRCVQVHVMAALFPGNRPPDAPPRVFIEWDVNWAP
jgi:hypothetical protein